MGLAGERGKVFSPIREEGTVSGKCLAGGGGVRIPCEPGRTPERDAAQIHTVENRGKDQPDYSMGLSGPAP